MYTKLCGFLLSIYLQGRKLHAKLHVRSQLQLLMRRRQLHAKLRSRRNLQYLLCGRKLQAKLRRHQHKLPNALHGFQLHAKLRKQPFLHSRLTKS